MHSAITDTVRQLLAQEEVLGVLALREENGCVAPYIFTSFEETDKLVHEPKWPLAKAAWNMARSMPEGRSFGLVCRGCDMRALEELTKTGQLRSGAVRTIGVGCSAEQATICLCETPFPPDEESPGERISSVKTLSEPASAEKSSAGVDPMSVPALRRLCLEPGRLELWRDHFSRCIKCYGCRNACPICVCPACKLEEDGYVSLGTVPPDPLTFHLIRVMHLADRCVGCGACQESCPAGLPLLALHLSMRMALRESTGYVSGTTAISPLLTAGREEGCLGTGRPQWEDTLSSRKPGGDEHAG
jgi:formate dehydrogenase (coenzyme F420) beta subunit